MHPKWFVFVFQALLHSDSYFRSSSSKHKTLKQTRLLRDCIKHHTQQSWLLWIIQRSVVALTKATLHSLHAFIFLSHTQSFLQPHLSSPILRLFSIPLMPLLSLSFLLSSHPLHSPFTSSPALLLWLPFSNASQQVYKVVLSVCQQQFLEGSQANKPSQCPLHDSQRNSNREREREREGGRIIKMRGQKDFKLLRAVERGQVGKGDWKKSGKRTKGCKRD